MQIVLTLGAHARGLLHLVVCSVCVSFCLYIAALVSAYTCNRQYSLGFSGLPNSVRKF